MIFLNNLEYPIILKNLKKNYNKVEALKGISFKIEKGEVFGFLGPNGAGKSTALNILTGILKPTSGNSYIFGKESKSIGKDIKQKIGVVFETNNLYKRLTGYENLKFFANLYGVGNKKIDYLLSFFELNFAKDRQVKGYSKGMKQRLLIARALLSDPELLILDEPTSGLDPQSVEIIHQAIESFAKQKKTVLLSTHFMEEADRLCDRIAFINKGKIVTITPPAVLKSRYGTKVLEIIIKNDDSLLIDLDEVVENKKIKKEKDKIIIELDLKKDKIGNLLEILNNNAEILSVHTREATLHQVFLELTKE